MITKRKAVCLGLLLAVWMLGVSPVAAQDAQQIERLERLLEEQQKQMESLQQQLNELKQDTAAAQTEAKEAKAEAKEGKEMLTHLGKTVTSGQERVKLSVSGQVNRAINIAGDGGDTKAYFIDNDASNTRVRFMGTAKVTDDLTIGTHIEMSLAPNESSQVNQDNEESGDFFDQRWAEVSFHSKRYGKLSLGKGDTASNNTAEMDLSQTDVVQYASVADIAGGLLFRERDGGELTDVRVSDAFKDLDGLSRKSRVRYDTPTFHGFSLAGSVVSDQRYDASLWWGGQGYGFKTACAFGFADPNEDNANYQYDGSFSVLHEDTGLNFTLSSGVLDRTDQDDQTNLFVKGGWLAELFSIGHTAFGVDYTKSRNFPTENDDSWSIGGAVVQHLDKFGTEVYLQYRYYTLNRDVEPDVYDINVGTMGVRTKF